MAQRVHVILEDDIDQSQAAETISFGLDGVSYEIDLSEAHAAQLRDDLAKWIGHGRRTGGRRSSGSSRPATLGRTDLAEVRDWGRTHGFQVNDRGRVSRELLDAYDKAKG